jgi:hypothetical protein
LKCELQVSSLSIDIPTGGSSYEKSRLFFRILPKYISWVCVHMFLLSYVYLLSPPCPCSSVVICCLHFVVLSLLSTSYKMVSNILLSRLSPYVDESIGNHQCGFWHNRSTTDQIFCMCQIMEKKWEYSETTSVIHRFQESMWFS